jgi:hypothetical protein
MINIKRVEELRGNSPAKQRDVNTSPINLDIKQKDKKKL